MVLICVKVLPFMNYTTYNEKENDLNVLNSYTFSGSKI
jgi:hypothetical protein